MYDTEMYVVPCGSLCLLFSVLSPQCPRVTSLTLTSRVAGITALEEQGGTTEPRPTPTTESLRPDLTTETQDSSQADEVLQTGVAATGPVKQEELVDVGAVQEGHGDPSGPILDERDMIIAISNEPG